MASGLPCIVLKIPEDYQFIKNGENGFIVDSEDPEKFYQRIQELITSPELFKRISVNAIKTVRDYDLSKTSAEISKLYEKILAE
jgi:glycosyltransferase involved in cell wall biosynthesis